MMKYKFRAWHQFHGMVYPNDSFYKIDVHSEVTSDAGRVERPVKLMMFTGIKDKNGREIYEGDILIYTRRNWKCHGHPKNNSDLRHIEEIYWDETANQMRNRGMFPSGGGWSGQLSFNDERADENILEVIGNIYENPDWHEKWFNPKPSPTQRAVL